MFQNPARKQSIWQNPILVRSIITSLITHCLQSPLPSKYHETFLTLMQTSSTYRIAHARFI